jgi:hypothetical protein
MTKSNSQLRNPLFDVDCLNVSNNRGYGPLPIPTLRDEQISSMLRKWALLDEFSRRSTSGRIDDDTRPTLLAYSERAASRAIRERECEQIFLGLLALGVDGWLGDWRENTLLLCLHFDAAKRIGVEPKIIFGDAAKLLSASVGESLRRFIRREPKDQTFESMGYEESADSDGFRYRRTW